MVLAPEHPLVDALVAAGAGPTGTDGRWTGGARDARPRPSRPTARRPRARPTSSGRPRARTRPASSPAPSRPTRSTATQIPVFIADYVLMGYGTGAIMAVPGQDERDWEFADGVRPADHPHGAAAGGPLRRTRRSPATARRSTPPTPRSRLDGLGVADAKARDHRLAGRPRASASGTVTYKLRDWLFSRQRYWGEPFPIVYDEDGAADRRCPSRCCRSSCPRSPTTRRRRSTPTTRTSEPGAAAVAGRRTGSSVELDLGDGPKTLPPRDQHDAAVGRLVLVRAALPGPDQRRARSSTRRSSGTGWARTRRASPARPRRRRPVRRRRRARRAAPAVRAVLAQGAVRPGPRVQRGAVPRLFNQGYIQAYAYTDERGAVRAGRRGRRGSADGGRLHLARRAGQPRVRQDGQVAEERRHPGRDVRARTAPTRSGCTRCRWARWTLSRPWETRAVVGVAAVPAAGVAQRGRRGDRRGHGSPTSRLDDATPRLLHRTIDGVRADYDGAAASTPRSPS